MLSFLPEPARDIPILHEADVCVLGGSCTGLFAAVRAARLGAKVAIVEQDNCFGGVATTGLVNVWHSLWDTEGKRQIIAGLTQETLERLDRRGAVRWYEKTNVGHGADFNSEELKIELDELAAEAKLKVYFHTRFCAPCVLDGRLVGVFVENKSGRGAIKARMFIDATGDGELAVRLGCENHISEVLQPPTMCARFTGWETLGSEGRDYGVALREHAERYGMVPGFAWGDTVPGSDVYMLAATRIYGVNPAEADDLTRAEIEGRRQVRAIQEILRQSVPGSRISLQALPSRIGVRESRHIRCAYRLTGDDVLYGRAFADTIAQGSYRVDIHHQDKPGLTFRYLDGKESYCRPGFPSVEGRWRPKTAVNPTFYRIPLRSLLPPGWPNVIVAGRMLDADTVAFAAVRVMVNLNQTGEAAGVAAALALQSGKTLAEVDPAAVRRTLVAGGSVLEGA